MTGWRDPDEGAHPPWCDPDQCRASMPPHPDAGVPAHLSYRFECNPRGTETVGLAVQLIRLVEIPDRDFLRVELTTVDERDAYHVELAQVCELARALPALLHLAWEAGGSG